MNRPPQPVDVDTFLASLRSRAADGKYTIALDGGELPVSVQLRESPAVVFTFTGAVDRGYQSLPRFAAASLHDHVPATVIALADPTLTRGDELTLAWYAGHEGFELQKILPGLLQQMIDNLGATRAAFVGSSGGGFAALYYSWQTRGSVAVVSNPQTNLDCYIRAHRRRYITTCWPGFEKDTPLSTVIDANLGPLYASQCHNSVVYLQVASDFFHIARHFAPFANALPREYGDRLIIRIADWGRSGHHPVPVSIWIPWMAAALSAPDTTAASIEATWAEQNTYQPPPLAPVAPLPGSDEQIAAELANAATAALLRPRSSGM